MLGPHFVEGHRRLVCPSLFSLLCCDLRVVSGVEASTPDPQIPYVQVDTPFLSNHVMQGSLKDTCCNHLKHGFFNTKIKGNNLEGNAQVYNVRIPVGSSTGHLTAASLAG